MLSSKAEEKTKESPKKDQNDLSRVEQWRCTAVPRCMAGMRPRMVVRGRYHCSTTILFPELLPSTPGASFHLYSSSQSILKVVLSINIEDLY